MRPPESARCTWIDAEGGKTSCIESVARLLTHESRTPLTAIIGFAELLLAGGGGPLSAEARASVGEIARAARDLESTMATAGLLIELGLLPPRSASGPLPLGPLLQEVGFDLRVEAPGPDGRRLVVLGTADRWAGILTAIRGFLQRRSDQGASCIAMALPIPQAIGLRLWAEPGPAEVSDLGRIELALAARLAATEGAALALGRHGEIRLSWPPERIPDPGFPAPATAPGALSDVS